MSDEDELAWTSSCDDERHEELVLDELNLAPVAGSQFGMPKTHPFNVFDEFSHKLDNENDAQDDAAHSNDDDDEEDEEALFEALDAAQSQVERMNNELDLDAPLGHSGKENTTPARGVAHARPVRRALAPRSEGNAQSSPMTPSWDGQSDGSRDFTDNYLADASCAEDEGRGTFVSEPLLTPRSPSPSPRFGMERDSELHDDEGKFLIERERQVPVQGFQVLEQIGNGTFGTVYKIASTNEDDNNMYVLKQVNLNGLTQAQQMETINEAHFMIELEDHDNIVKHHSSFIEGGCLNMVMEFCGGGDLHGRIRTHKIQGTRFDEDFIWQVLIQICTALQHLHQHRILHRDIKPENVFLDANDQVKVGDLGLGRLLSSQSRFAHSTVGTPFYFSPELCEEALYDERSDIWALGCVVYQMATLNVPFFANNQIALARKIVGEDIRPMPSHYSKDLHFLVHKMLEKDPQNRPDAQQILNYGPVRIRDMQARIDLRERQLSTLHTQRERELLDSNDLLKKQLEACKTEMGEMRKSYEHLIAQARQAESVANQRVCVLENRVLELAQALQSHNPNIPIQELSHGLAGPFGNLDDVRGNDGREEQGRNRQVTTPGKGPSRRRRTSRSAGQDAKSQMSPSSKQIALQPETAPKTSQTVGKPSQAAARMLQAVGKTPVPPNRAAAAARTPATRKGVKAPTPASCRMPHGTRGAKSHTPSKTAAVVASATSPVEMKTPQPVLATKPGRALSQVQAPNMSADVNKKRLRARKNVSITRASSPPPGKGHATRESPKHNTIPPRRIMETPAPPASKENRRRSWTSSKTAHASNRAGCSPSKGPASATRGLGPARRVPSSFLEDEE